MPPQIMAPHDNEIFAVLKVARRVWAVAAIHGESTRLGSLHAELERRFQAGDRLVYLGDYLGYGPDIPGTMDELLRFRARLLCHPGTEPWDIAYLRGGQEEMWHKLLQLQFAKAPAEVFDWMLQQGVGATLQAYGGRAEDIRARFREGVLAITKWSGQMRDALRARPGHEALLTALRRAAYTEGGELLFAHAGVDPHRPLSEQSDAFWWGSGYFSAMTERFAGFKMVVSGYDRMHRGARFGAVSCCIDGGCGFGGSLNAGCFDLEGQRVDWIEA